MKRINFKSDFKVQLVLLDGQGNDIGVPDYDWIARFFTSPKFDGVFVSCLNGQYTNCEVVDGRIIAAFDNHGLLPGVLNVEVKALLPDSYQDGSQSVVVPKRLDIELVREAAEAPSSVEAELLLPYIQGAVGETGQQGPVGPQGEVGPAGKDGKDGNNGLSAYEQAVQGGYKGTEAEFIASLADADEMVRHEPADAELETIEPSIVTNALRKTEQSLTSEEQQQVLKNLGNPEFKVFVDMWNNAAGVYGCYNEETGFFELHGITDLTYNDAMTIMNAGYIHNTTTQLFYSKQVIRTHLPSKMQVSAMSSERTFQNCSNIERVVAPLIIAATYCFYECAKLKSLKVYAPNNSNEKNSGIYLGCANLETIEFSTIYNGSFSLEDSPKINSTTIGNFIKKYNSTSPITITVHPDVYAKLTDENNTEWNSLLTLASSKNIQFATA